MSIGINGNNGNYENYNEKNNSEVSKNSDVKEETSVFSKMKELRQEQLEQRIKEKEQAEQYVAENTPEEFKKIDEKSEIQRKQELEKLVTSLEESEKKIDKYLEWLEVTEKADEFDGYLSNFNQNMADFAKGKNNEIELVPDDKDYYKNLEKFSQTLIYRNDSNYDEKLNADEFMKMMFKDNAEKLNPAMKEALMKKFEFLSSLDKDKQTISARELAAELNTMDLDKQNLSDIDGKISFSDLLTSLSSEMLGNSAKETEAHDFLKNSTEFHYKVFDLENKDKNI